MYFDFRCTACAHRFEAFVKPTVNPVCPKCSKDSKRLISAPTLALPGTDPDFPTAYEKWERTRAAKAADDKKFYDKHGADKKHHSYGS